jgi:hypothetical protein
MRLAEVCRKHAENCEVLAQSASPLQRAQLHKGAHIWRLLAEAVASNEATAGRRSAEPERSDPVTTSWQS